MSGSRRAAMKNVVTDADRAILKEKYEFIPEKKKTQTWQDRMVEKYQSGLYKEYALADLSRPGKVGLRWRTKNEVLEGVGERTCGSKTCMATSRLITLRVPFAYMEQGVSKMEIVKLRLCPKCEPLVNKKSSGKEAPPNSKKAETDEGKQKAEGPNPPDTSNQEQGSPNSREDDKSTRTRRKDTKKRRDKDVESEDEERSRSKKRRRKSHKSDRRIGAERFEYQGELETFGGYPVTQELPSAFKPRYKIDLGNGEHIIVQIYKEFVRVKFFGGESTIGNTVGLMGDYKSGKTFARDGSTIMHDFTDLGNEWQVLPTDGLLFHEVSKPQFPETCVIPEDPRGDRRRRLAESSITVEEAEAACASLVDELTIKDCVYDILATQDMDMVGAF